MNKNFDIQRLGMVIRWDFLNYWKGYLYRTVGLAMVLAIFGVFQLNLFRNSSYIFNDGDSLAYFMQEQMCSFFMVIASLLFFISISNIFGNMNTKLQRETYLMLPATKIEKYISRFLLMTIGSITMMFIALVIADVIQFVFSFFITPGFHVSITWETLRLPFVGNDRPHNYWMIVCLIVSFYTFVHSFFALGGTIYRRYPVLLTICTVVILCMIFGYWILQAILAFFGMDFKPNADVEKYCFLRNIILSTIFLALAAFNYWASYKIFTRMQVICNKWINI